MVSVGKPLFQKRVGPSKPARDSWFTGTLAAGTTMLIIVWQQYVSAGTKRKFLRSTFSRVAAVGFQLALSGGGFRAALFHLGAVRYLRQSSRLKQVESVFSVSGGSILAAHMVLNWEMYNGDVQSFQEATDQIISFIRDGVARRAVPQVGLLVDVCARHLAQPPELDPGLPFQLSRAVLRLRVSPGSC